MFDQHEFKKYATKHVGINSLTYDSYVSAITPGIRNLTPNIIEERQLNVSVLDVFSRLMMDRIIFLGTGINDQVAKEKSNLQYAEFKIQADQYYNSLKQRWNNIFDL